MYSSSLNDLFSSGEVHGALRLYTLRRIAVCKNSLICYEYDAIWSTGQE